jgi:hypothetical protein
VQTFFRAVIRDIAQKLPKIAQWAKPFVQLDTALTATGINDGQLSRCWRLGRCPTPLLLPLAFASSIFALGRVDTDFFAGGDEEREHDFQASVETGGLPGGFRTTADGRSGVRHFPPDVIFACIRPIYWLTS